ncbi:MAG: trypsin-like peptidase domain-containing protein [Ruminococcus sp.]|nr:trypsin-like peptidase domain-containing protein [Ruminococcus sp.]
MDDIENYTSGNVPEQETQNTPIQDNQDIPQNETVDIDSTVNDNTINNNNTVPDNNSYTAYQDFMYGYEPPAPDINSGIRKRKNTSGEKFIIFLFIAIILLAVGLSIYGITTDIYNSQKVIDDIKQQHHVVMYKQTKPNGANDLSNFVDENGKYTIEGVSAYVKNSIVEIYTYTDKTRRQMSGTGSGVVISEDGYIVTNAHVLNADGFHAIHTADDKVYDARIIGRDSKTDIAVIKVDNANLVPAVLGNSDEAIVGEQVIAVGNPAGLSNTVTDGIISAVNRKIRSDSTGFEMNCIQTNADISPGNSGGALVNMYGQVIGITSSKYVSSSFEGLGFAITINDALPIIEELIDTGFVGGRFRIGIQLIDMASEEKIIMIESELGFEIPEDFGGVYIDAISEDCDIANTDLKAGDFITEIDGTPIMTYDELYDNISSKYGAGDTVPAKCAHVEKNGKVTYYDIKFKLMEDTSGDY